MWSWGWGEAVPQKLTGSSATSPVGGGQAGSVADTGALQTAGAAPAPSGPSPATAEADMRSWSIFNLVGRRKQSTPSPTPPPGETSEVGSGVTATVPSAEPPKAFRATSASTDADGSPAGGRTSDRVSMSPSEYFDADDETGSVTNRDSQRSASTSPTKDDGTDRLEEPEDQDDQPMVTPREAPPSMMGVDDIPVPLAEPEEDELVTAVANGTESGTVPRTSSLAADTGSAQPSGAEKLVAEVAGLGLSLCADKLEELKTSRASGAVTDDASTEESLRRHEIFERHRVSADTFNTDAALVLANPQLMVRLPDGRIYPAGLALPFVVAKLAFGDAALPVDQSCGKTFYARGHNSPHKESGQAEAAGEQAQGEGATAGGDPGWSAGPSQSEQSQHSTSGGWFGWWKGATPSQAEETASSDSAQVGTESSSVAQSPGVLPKPAALAFTGGDEAGSRNISYMKSLKPSAEALESLNLKDGVNEMVSHCTHTSFLLTHLTIQIQQVIARRRCLKPADTRWSAGCTCGATRRRSSSVTSTAPSRSPTSWATSIHSSVAAPYHIYAIYA